MFHRVSPWFTAVALLGSSLAHAAETVLITAGFEAPSFIAGVNIEGQAGWKASINAAVNYDATISTARAAAGLQSVRLSNGVVNQPNYPFSFAGYSTPLGTQIELGGFDPFFMTTKVFVEQAAPGGWGMGLSNSLGGLVYMYITGDGKVTYANMNSPTQVMSNTGLALVNNWVTLTMKGDATQPGLLLLNVSTDSGSWSGSMGKPTTSNTATSFYVGSPSTSVSSGPAPLAYFDEVRVGYNMAAPVPEASTWAMMGLGLATLAARRRRQRNH